MAEDADVLNTAVEGLTVMGKAESVDEDTQTSERTVVKISDIILVVPLEECIEDAEDIGDEVFTVALFSGDAEVLNTAVDKLDVV